MKDIRVIGFDLDDTALDAHKVLRPAVREAIHLALERGLTVLPATGRILGGIPAEVLTIPGIRYAITGNGAKVRDLADGRVLFQDCFDDETAISLVEAFRKYPCLISLYADDKAYIEARDIEFLRPITTPEIFDYIQKTRIRVDDLTEFVRQSAAPVEKFSNHFADMDQLALSWREAEARGDTAVTSSLDSNIELNTTTANKGAALLKLASLLGYERRQVMAVGDGLNDIEMLKAVGCGVAMANARPQVLAVADRVTGSYEEEGLAQAILAVLPT